MSNKSSLVRVFRRVRSSADNNLFDAFNDVLTGGAGDDILVGDVGYVEGDVGHDIFFNVFDSTGVDNSFDVFNDSISGGAGDDLLVGDVGLLNNASPIFIDVTDINGGDTFKVFSDTLNGDGGNDIIFGDFASGDLAAAVIGDFTPAGTRSDTASSAKVGRHGGR